MQGSDSGNLYKRVRKIELEKKKEISCGYCRFHRGENKTWNRPKDTKYKKIDRKTIRKLQLKEEQMIQGTKIFIYGDEVTLEETVYGNGRRAIVASIRNEDGYIEPFGKLTINIPKSELEDDEIIVKDWSENVEFAEACYNTGLFEDTGKKVITGHIQAPIWRIKK